MNKKLLINANVGEGSDDKLVMPYLDCANIACGGHAGDEATMKQALKLVKKYKIMAGAQPGYPDWANFGRVSMDFSAKELMRCLHNQIASLTATAEKLDYPLSYIKPHGALKQDMIANKEIFHTICTLLVAANCPNVLIVPINQGLSWQHALASEYSIDIWWEVSADRRYEANGLPRSCNEEDAMHANPEQILAQLEQIVTKGSVTTVDGSLLNVTGANTVCIQGNHAASLSAIKQWNQA